MGPGRTNWIILHSLDEFRPNSRSELWKITSRAKIAPDRLRCGAGQILATARYCGEVASSWEVELAWSSPLDALLSLGYTAIPSRGLPAGRSPGTSSCRCGDLGRRQRQAGLFEKRNGSLNFVRALSFLCPQGCATALATCSEALWPFISCICSCRLFLGNSLLIDVILVLEPGMIRS